MFLLTDKEWQNLKSQNVISSFGGYCGVRKLLNILTEQGVAIFPAVPLSNTGVNIRIVIIIFFSHD